MKKCSLNGIYRGTGISPSGDRITFDAQVPGCVHTDLLNNGTFKDLFYSMNAEQCQWIENWDFEFEREFYVTDLSGNEYIEFDGLDVFCDVFLNDIKIGAADDMFIQYRFDVGNALVTGSNKLRIYFHSPIKAVENKPRGFAAFTAERINIRRIQCTFGWDWINRFVTCGIWKDVTLCVPQKARIESVYVRTAAIDPFSAQIIADFEFDIQNPGSFIVINVLSPSGTVLFKKRRLIVEKMLRETFEIRQPQIWWPAGYGEQPLYKIDAVIEDSGIALDKKVVRFGIRSVRILQLPDETGSAEYYQSLALKKNAHLLENDRNQEFSGFTLIVNGTPVMCKGANWVPCEPFVSDCKAEKYETLLKLAKEGNFNMLRVWGGGIFENDFFYDQCDELGLMVTQDFLMACGKYPEDDPWFVDRITKEVTYAAKHLRNHPSLVWWTGDNENGAGGDENNPDFLGRKISFETIFPVLEKYDGSRLFIPSSPYGGFPNMSATKGTSHNTCYLELMANYVRYNDLKDYRNYFEGFLARFVAEATIMGAPSLFSLKKFMSDEEIFGENDEVWRYHTRNHPAEPFKEFGLFDFMVTMSEKLFGKFTSNEDKLFKMQYVQYEWVRITMESFRRNKWYSSGILYWMFNDCWPASGWSLIDYYCHPKAGYYGFKRAAKSVIASIEKKGEEYVAFLCNDLPRNITSKVRMFVQSTKNSAILAEYAGEYETSANTSAPAISVNESYIDPLIQENAILICEISGDYGRDRAFFIPVRPQDITYAAADVTITEQTGEKITLISDQYVPAVRLDGQYVFDDNYFDLLPNESKTVAIKPLYNSQGGEVEISWLNKSRI